MARLSPSDYLTKVLNTIEKRALQTKKVSWKDVRKTCFEMAADAQNTAATYGAINFVLDQLGDNHSFLIARNGAGTRAHYEAPAVPKRAATSEILRSGKLIFGYVVVKNCGSGEREKTDFAGALQKHILTICSEQNPHGWIVDLRENIGGNMWSMLVGVGPLLGSGTAGYFTYPTMSIPWFYENGQAGVINKIHGKHANFEMKNSMADLEPRPVVVLIGPATASSGEAVAISFKGRADTHFIGQRTRGLSTNNERIKLPDGATLYLTTSGEADRNKVAYNAGVDPDSVVEQGDCPLGAGDDPGLQAAVESLASVV